MYLGVKWKGFTFAKCCHEFDKKKMAELPASGTAEKEVNMVKERKD
jgi:hypothetical protein